MASNLIGMILIGVVTLLAIFYPLLYKIKYSEDTKIQYQAAESFLSIIWWVLPAMVLIILVALVYNLIITHRICGPLVNFTHTFNKMSEGDLTRKVILRTGDFLNNESESLNRMIDGLADHVSGIKENSQQLLDLVEDRYTHADDFDTKEKAKEILLEIKNGVQSVVDDLAFFKQDQIDSTARSDTDNETRQPENKS
jgi:methyl-accepting chemotaxis protein